MTDLVRMRLATLSDAPGDEATLDTPLSPASQHPVVVYLAGLAPGSRRAMRDALRIIAALASGGTHTELSFPWSELRYQHTAAIRAALQERYAPATTNKMLSALRRVLKEAQRLGQLSNDEYAAAVDFRPVHGERPAAAAGRALARGELRALLDACAEDPSAAGARDAAIIALGYACGLRRAELVALDLTSYDRTTGTLTIHGKRHKIRALPLEAGAREALDDWLLVRGEVPGPLFVRIRCGGHIGTERLTDQAIYHIEAMRAAQAGVAPGQSHLMNEGPGADSHGSRQPGSAWC